MGFFSMRVSKKKGPVEAPKWVERVTFDGRPYFYNTSVFSQERISWDKPDELMTTEEKEKTTGEWVWVPHPSDYWQPAKVVKRSKDGSTIVQPYKGQQFSIPSDGKVDPCRESGGRTQHVPMWPVNHTSLNFLEDDLIALDPVNHATILHNIKQRYLEDEIYTWVGAGRRVLLSVNPYQELSNKYNDDLQLFHKTTRADKPDKWISPHVYAIANEAYDALVETDSDQSILVSGESGAGKTEATKHCLNFLAQQVGSDIVDHQVSQKLISSGPLLEAFGNAKTLRNNNSSRFGKWIKVSFNRDSEKISGAEFSNFMLEKTRVIHHQEHERNFHIFYQLLQDAEFVKQFNLKSVKDYRYVNQSKKSQSSNDAADLVRVKLALDQLEFPKEEQTSLFGILAGILNVGNLQFKDKQMDSNVTGSEIKDDSWLIESAEFFKVDVESFRQVVSFRTVEARGESHAVALDADKAKDGCDALVKSIYGNMFDFLVYRMNDSMAPPPGGHFIGFLDIFGFEILEVNSFEQLCINYCNEKLQQYFNNHTFQSEELFYKTEGVEFSFLQFVDNQAVLDLLESKKTPNGILVMLDDEGALPGGSDSNWVGKVEKSHGGNTLFECDFRRKFESNLSFEIHHYAGIVKYDADGFVVKNKDTMYNDMYALMSSSSDPVIQKMFPRSNVRLTKIKPVAAQFRAHLTDLISLIDSTDPRYIRCIKPNESMKPKAFQSPHVVEQLQFSGVFETVDIRKGGYPFRLTHKQFAYRFSCINVGFKYGTKNNTSNARNRCAEILNTHQHDFSEDVVIGNSMVLYRVSVHKPLLLYRNLAIEVTLPKVQAVIRGSLSRDYTNRMMKAHATLRRAMNAPRKLAEDLATVRKGFKLTEQALLWLAEGKRSSYLPAYPMFVYAAGKVHQGLLVADIQAAFRGGISRDYTNQMHSAQNTLSESLKKGNDIKMVRKGFQLVESTQAWLKEYPSFKLPEYPMHLVNKGKHLESRLMAWEDLQMEMESLTGSKKATDVDVKLYNALIAVCKEADTALVDVTRTNAQQDLYEHTQMLIKTSPPGLLDSEAQPALESLNRKRMQKVQDKSDELGYTTETIEKITFILNRLSYIDGEALNSLDLVDGSRMRKVLEEAHEYKHTDANLKDIEELLKTPEKKFVQMELESAIKHSDMPREIHRRIRLKEIFYEEEGDKFVPLANSKVFRDSVRYAGASKALCGKTGIMRGQQSFTKSLIPAPLTVLPNEDLTAAEDSPQLKETKRKIIKNFKNLLTYMGEKKTKRPEKFANAFLTFGMENPEFRDELYIQIVKQLTNNPDPASVALGYEILGMALRTFLPSPDLEDWLVMWIRTNPPPNGDFKPLTSALHMLKFSQGAQANVMAIPALKKELQYLAKQGSHFSINPGAYTGPTNTFQPQDEPQI